MICYFTRINPPSANLERFGFYSFWVSLTSYHGDSREPRKLLNVRGFMKYRIMAAALLFINSQVFFISAANPLGTRWAQEMFLGFLLFYSTIYLGSRILLRGILSRNDMFVWAIVLAIFIGSPIFALIQYGQPIVYGLIESRQSLSILIYFPLKRLITTGRVDADLIFKYIVFISLSILAVSMLMKVGVVSINANSGPVDPLRPDRNSMGRYYYILSFMISLVKLYRTRDLKWAISLIIFLYAIFFVLQERQSMIAVILVGIVYIGYNGLKVQYLKSSFLALTLISIIAIFFLYGLEDQRARLMILIGDTFSEKTTESVRANTVATMWEELSDSKGLGFGALSLMWNDGFHRFYGGNFYLGDVGIFGTFFRLGFLAVPLLAFVFYRLIVVLRRMPPSDNKNIVVLSLLYALFTSPTSGLLEYRGFFFGMLFCIVVTAHYSHKRIYQAKPPLPQPIPG